MLLIYPVVVIMKVFFLFLADILCNFEQNKCNWQITTNDPNGAYTWSRKSSNQLHQNDIPGPDGDFQVKT